MTGTSDNDGVVLHTDAQPFLENDRTRIVGLSRGDAHSPHDSSGIPLHLFDALARRYTLVGRLDTRLPRWQRAIVAGTTVAPMRARWAERYFKNLLAFDLISRHSERQLQAFAAPFDVALQFNGLFQTRGAPYLVFLDTTYHDAARHWPEWNPLRGQRLVGWYARERALYHEAQHVFAMSVYAKDSLTDFYGLASGRVTAVGGGVNIAVMAPPPRPPAGHSPTVLFIGKEFKRKGGDSLLVAFRQVRAALPGARLRIIGTGSVRAEPGVEVIGRIGDRALLARYYAEATVFCLPSRYDPFPGVLMEAMAHGVPCVSTMVCGIPEIVVAGETGLLVPPDDSAALAAALLRLLTDPAYAAQLGAAGRRRTEAHLDWDRVVERMAPVLDGLHKHGPRRAVPYGNNRSIGPQ